MDTNLTSVVINRGKALLASTTYIDEFEKYLVDRNYSKYTVKDYVKYVTQFLHTVEEPYSVSTLHLQEYVDSFNEKPATANLIVNALRAYYRYLCNVRGVIDRNPAVDVKGMKIETEEKEYFTPEEVAELLGAMQGDNMNRNRLITSLMALDCLRISEVMNINVDDIDLEKGTIYIHGKGKRNRIAYLTEKMREYLYNYMQDRQSIRNLHTNALFPSRDGKGRIARTTIEKFLKQAGEVVGVHVHPHKFRHTGATLSYQASKDLVAVQNLLGHENIESTKRYTHVSESDRRNLVENSPLNAIL